MSGEGVVPIAASQDSPGPMARTVRDVAALYEVLTGLDHVLERVNLEFGDARIGVATNMKTGHPATDGLFSRVVELARSAGTTLRDITVLDPNETVDPDEVTVLISEMYDDLDRLLDASGWRRTRSRWNRSSTSKTNIAT